MTKPKKEKVFWMNVPPIEPPEYYYRFWDNKSGCHLDKIRVHRRTLAGAFLCTQKPNGLQAFVLNVANKKFACPTVEAARVSFLARKKWQLSYLKSTLSQVEAAVKAMNEGRLEYYPNRESPYATSTEIGMMVLPGKDLKDELTFYSLDDLHD